MNFNGRIVKGTIKIPKNVIEELELDNGNKVNIELEKVEE